VLGIAVLAGLLGRRYGWLPEAGELATGTGERRDFTLEDGSALSLNARTRVVAQFDATQRLLALRTGELLVDVAKDPRDHSWSRPNMGGCVRWALNFSCNRATILRGW
jgi:transmembrane sensor